MGDDRRPESATAPANGPLRIARLTAQAYEADKWYPPGDIARDDPGFDPTAVIAVQINAEPTSPCPRDEWRWWRTQLHPQVNISGGTSSRAGVHQFSFKASPDDVERQVRELAAAIADVSIGYPANFEAWKRERQLEADEETARQGNQSARYQAILDHLSDELGLRAPYELDAAPCRSEHGTGESVAPF